MSTESKVVDVQEQKAPEGKPLSAALKLFYGIGDFGFTFMTSVESYFFNFFLTNLAAFSLGTAGIITTVSSVVDAALSWIYGAILNSIKPKKWGRYRSWLVLLPWIVPFLFAFQFIRISDNEFLAATVITIAAIVAKVTWNFPYVANVSMIAVAGKTPNDRSQLASTRGAWANLSKVAFSYAAPAAAAVSAGLLGEVNKYAGVAFAFAALMAVLYFAHFKMFDGYEDVEAEQKNASAAGTDKSEKVGGKDLVTALFQNRPLLILILADFAKWMFNFVVMGIAIYYFTYVAKNPAMMATYILVSNLMCVIGSYLAKSLSKAITTRTTAIVIYLMMAVVMIIARFVYTNPTVVLVLMAVAQFGYGVAYACTPALYADTIVYSEWKTGKNATGWISGLQNVPLKIGVVMRGIVIASVLSLGGFSAKIDPAQATVALQEGICLGFMVIPAIVLVLGALLLIFGFNLKKEDVEKYQTEIASRKAA
ncbi:MAG: Na+/melibiose symporter and related transporter [Actinobacteria bacterium]|nr:Na+/melibiose symporter and related transporter [Actinomycetota bacterium]